MVDTVLKTSADTVKISVDAPEAIREKLSEAFVLEMTRQLTAEISRAMAISGLPESNVELKLVFAPETFMEHSSENITYRRLLITDKACGDKDFWVKWTRNNGAVAYSMFDNPAFGDVTFELGEDVPQKIREKEYRFLVRSDTDKYHYAMGRKNITEWRELIKRAIKRGDLTKIVSALETDEPSSDVNDALSSILSSFGVSTVAAEPKVETASESTEFEDALRRAQEALLSEYSDEEEKPPFDFTATEEEAQKADFEPICDEDDADRVDEEVTELEEKHEEELEQGVAIPDEEEIDEPAPIPAPMDVIEPAARVSATDEERIRAEAEARVRLEYETAARERAERQNEAISAELSAMKAENERLRGECAMLKIELTDLRAERGALEAKKKELEGEISALTEKLGAAEAERDDEKRRLREEIEARERAESRELERLEEAAILAVEAKRKAEEKEAEEKRLAAEAERLANEERERAEEARRLDEERRKEAERIRLDMEISRGNLPPVTEEEDEPAAPISPTEYTYTSKTVKLMFKSRVAEDAVSKIYEIIKTTIEYYKKENVSIRIKASVPDESTVMLNFVKIPEQESELFVNIIKTLGSSNIGIMKAIVE